MSNRIAAFRAADRIETAAWMPQAARRTTLGEAAGRWLRGMLTQGDALTLSPRLRLDAGLADAIAAPAGVLNFEARRLGF